MALIDFNRLRAPLSEQAPCGSDLERDGDAVYMNLMAEVEGLLPASYFTFDRNAAGLSTAMDVLSRLLERTYDLRVLTLLAKLLVFDRNLGAFSSCVETIAWLLDHQWADVHPNGDDIELRGAVLQTLDDLPHVIFPLQYLPLITSRRLGGISFRTYQVARGDAKPRAEETALDVSAIEQAVADCDLTSLIATRDEISRLRTSVALVQSAWIAHEGYSNAPSLDRLAELVAKMLDFVDGAVGKRDPSAALTSSREETEPDSSTSETATVDDGIKAAAKPLMSKRSALASLAAVVAYFHRCEPSNPALLMIRQAQDLVGKNFIEVLRILTPEHFDEARIHIGPERRVSFPMDRLSELLANKSAESSDAVEVAEPLSLPDIQTRAQAVAELERVTGFYKSSEPSSPIPLLIDRARTLIPLDFLSLLKEIAPRAEN